MGALVIFCLLCFSVYALGRWFVFRSPVQMTTVLHVGKGTVGLAEPGADEKVVRATDTVARNDTMRTDGLSQGYLEFSDPYTGDVVATVMLRNDSSMTLSRASRPRFNLSDDPYVMQLTEVEGRVEVWVADGTEREIRLEIISPLGTLHITDPGVFLVNSTLEAGVMTAMPRVGTATLISASGAAQHLTVSTEGRIVLDEPTILANPGRIDLLPNWAFDQGGDWAKYWACAQDSPIQGFPEANVVFGAVVEGRKVVHIERMDEDPGPATTFCIQGWNWETYLDVSQYEALHLRVTMRVHHQSLSACGVAGTECPVLLQFKYIDGDGNLRDWYHGFYARYEPNLGGRKICDACWTEHEFINKDAWYTYESGNLFTDLPAFPESSDDVPRIKEVVEIRFYAGGHQFDMMLSEVALLATPPTD